MSRIITKEPKIAHADAVQRWHNMIHYEWEESTSSCGVCPTVFATGDVILVFGKMDNVAEKRAYVCVRCGVVAMAEEGGLAPCAAMAYVEKRFRSRSFDEVPGTEQRRLYEAFRIIDEMAAGVRQAADEGRSTS